MQELEEKVLNLMLFCKDKNLKLNPEKFLISEQVEFGGSVISAETVRDEDVIFVGPKNKRVRAFQSLKSLQIKERCRSYVG